MMCNYPILENTILNLARKATLLLVVVTFSAAIYFFTITIQLIMVAPKAPLSAEIVDIEWTEPEDYLLDIYEEYTSQVITMPHSDSEVKVITDKLKLPERDSGIPMLVMTFFLKHPEFNIETANLQQIQDKVDEYSEWMDSMAEGYDEIDHYHAGLLQWVKDFTADPVFYDFVYSLPLYSEELEFGEVEEAVDDAIITYSEKYDDALSSDYEAQEFFQMELSEYQQEIDSLVMKMSIALVISGFFLLIVLLFRIEQRLNS